jgi:hypothetical protein
MRAVRIAAAAGFVIFVGTAPAARAGDLTQPKTVILSAENLTELNFVSRSNGGGDFTYFAFLGNPSAQGPYDLPRFAVDVLVTDRLTVGGALVFARVAPDRGANQTIFAISPRAGFMIPVTDRLSIWPRGGFTYYNLDSAGGVSFDGFALDLEGMAIFKLIDHFGLVGGAAVDAGLTGTGHLGGFNADAKFTDFGLRVGLIGWL